MSNTLISTLIHIVEQLLLSVMHWIHGVMDALGYLGVVVLMAIESCNIPLPSEMILPYAGVLVQQGTFNLHLAALAGALGCVVGSLPSYALGYWGGEGFVRRYGKWLLMSEHDLDKAQQWVARFGDWTFFLCRMLPVVRTFISLPAGVFKARLLPFIVGTFVGSLFWSYGLIWVGIQFGKNMAVFKHYWHQFDAVIVGVLLVLGVWYVWKHTEGFRSTHRNP
ncbi:MAG: DedA family protein [Vampirovibrionales bacterium]